MKLNPLADRVLLKAVETEETTASGIILSTATKEKPEVFEVVSAGPGGVVDGNVIEMVVKAGDRVVTSKYSGTEVKLDGEEYVIVRQRGRADERGERTAGEPDRHQSDGGGLCDDQDHHDDQPEQNHVHPISSFSFSASIVHCFRHLSIGKL